MPSVCRLNDICTGHDGFPPRPAISGSPDVMINGLPAHRLSDVWAFHGKPDNPSHDGVLSAGSSTVFVNGLPLGRIGDSISCGSFVNSGSPDVNAGG